MEKKINVEFAGNKKINATVGSHTVYTDQRPDFGGDGSAAEPFDLFLASLATCAGVYAKGFCENRQIDTTNLGLSMACYYNAEEKRYDRIEFHLTLPDNFPEKYRSALLRSIDQCAVKKHMITPPDFVTVVNEP